MKLQLNNSGAWKNLLDFDAAALTEVMHLTSRLYALATPDRPVPSLRITGDDDKVQHYWHAARGWWSPKDRG